MTWQFISTIGLEVHVQLATAEKLFCADLVDPAAPPNSRVCPVCLGYPGALPVLDPAAVHLALRAALALGCTIAGEVRFDRKCYFYPDLPKGYQITQQRHPLGMDGEFEYAGPRAGDQRVVRTARIERVHLEEDTARTVDMGDGNIGLDFNRAGIALIEIVTAPGFESGADARAFLSDLRRALIHLGVSECAMEHGGLRVDANVSVAQRGRMRDGNLGGAVTEIKNLNSFQAVERSIEAEITRQRELLGSGGVVESVTLNWDAATRTAMPVREKSAGGAYRYHPDPDLPGYRLPQRMVDEARIAIPELPRALAQRFVLQDGITAEHAESIAAEPWSATLFQGTVRAGASGPDAASWVLGELSAARNARTWTEDDPSPDLAGRLAELIGLVRDGALSRAAGREVLGEMLRTAEPPAAIVRARGLSGVDSGDEFDGWVTGALAEDPRAAARLRAGEDRLVDYFVGKVMRASRGRADPVAAAERVASHAAPDVGPDVGPDVAPAVAPDVGPDVAPAVAPAVAPDVAPRRHPEERSDEGPP